MMEWEQKSPGRLIGFPKESVYSDLKIGAEGEWDEDVIQNVEVSTSDQVAR